MTEGEMAVYSFPTLPLQNTSWLERTQAAFAVMLSALCHLGLWPQPVPPLLRLRHNPKTVELMSPGTSPWLMEREATWRRDPRGAVVLY